MEDVGVNVPVASAEPPVRAGCELKAVSGERIRLALWNVADLAEARDAGFPIFRTLQNAIAWLIESSRSVRAGQEAAAAAETGGDVAGILRAAEFPEPDWRAISFGLWLAARRACVAGAASDPRTETFEAFQDRLGVADLGPMVLSLVELGKLSGLVPRVGASTGGNGSPPPAGPS